MSRPTNPARSRHGVAAIAAALLLAACGGGADDEVTAPSGEATDEPAPAEAPAPDPADEDEDREPGELGAHRPAETLDAACDEVDADPPGAVIVFPGADERNAGRSPVTIEVVGCSDTFEANVVYEAYHEENRRPTIEGHTMGGTMGQWDEFRFEETFWTPGDWRIVVLEIDAKSGERREYDEVVVTVEPA